LSVAERPADAQGRNVLGTILFRLDDVPGAIAAFEQATRLDPTLTEARVNLAQALRKTGRQDDARAALAEVQELKERETSLGRALVLLGMASHQLANGQRDAAVLNLRDAAAAAPDLAEVHYELGRALLRDPARRAEAEDALLRSVELDPRNARFRFEWAQLLVARGDQVAALDQLRQAVELQPSLAEAQRELARLALREHDWTQAAIALRAALAWEQGDAALPRPRLRQGLARRGRPASRGAPADEAEPEVVRT
jgi:Flp pilus assembly protein TadD